MITKFETIGDLESELLQRSANLHIRFGEGKWNAIIVSTHVCGNGKGETLLEALLAALSDEQKQLERCAIGR